MQKWSSLLVRTSNPYAPVRTTRRPIAIDAPTGTACCCLLTVLKTCHRSPLAVKPQNVKTVAANLDGSSLDDTLLVSIMAGVTIDELKSEFKTDRIVRSMPNTPAAILEGITVWTVSTLDYTPGYTGQA
jgi:hypothetical protein